MDELRHALRIQGRVLYALILREALNRHGKSKIGYLWALLEPIGQVLVLTLIFSEIGRKSPVGGDLTVFFITGIIPWLLYSNIANRLSGAISANQALLCYPQVTSTDVLFARLLLEAVTMITVFILMVVLLQWFGKAFAVYDLFNVIAALLVLVFFAAGIGMINATIRLYFDSWDKIFSTLNRPLSKIFYPNYQNRGE